MTVMTDCAENKLGASYNVVTFKVTHYLAIDKMCSIVLLLLIIEVNDTDQ